MTDYPFRSYLLKKDSQLIKEFLQSNDLNEILVPTLNDLLYVSASIKPKQNTIIHPVCVMNSIKNIIGDNRKKPSLRLIEFAIDYLGDYEYFDNSSNILDDVAKEGIGATAFLGDLEEACQLGDWESAKIYTAKIFLASDRSRGVLDLLCELALQDSRRNTLFIFHILRAYQFQEIKEDNWAYTFCIFNWLVNKGLPEPHPPESINPENVLDIMIKTGDLIWFSALMRLWNGDYVRIRSYRRELSYGLSQANKIYHRIEENDFSWLKFDNPKKFIEVAEKIITSDISKSVKAQEVVTLEAVRALSRLISAEQNNILITRLNASL
tara:strand:+ start:1302 stop:2273 length:972 start_codon:yes stop_codon:yes gene_type:complete